MRLPFCYDRHIWRHKHNYLVYQHIYVDHITPRLDKSRLSFCQTDKPLDMNDLAYQHLRGHITPMFSLTNLLQTRLFFYHNRQTFIHKQNYLAHKHIYEGLIAPILSSPIPLLNSILINIEQTRLAFCSPVQKSKYKILQHCNIYISHMSHHFTLHW